jgi:hypothetical protein
VDSVPPSGHKQSASFDEYPVFLFLALQYTAVAQALGSPDSSARPSQFPFENALEIVENHDCARRHIQIRAGTERSNQVSGQNFREAISL